MNTNQAVQHLQALIAAIKAEDAAIDVSRSAAKALAVAIIRNRVEYDLAAMMGDPYPDEVYDAMDAVQDASEGTAKAYREHAEALGVATSYVESVTG